MAGGSTAQADMLAQRPPKGACSGMLIPLLDAPSVGALTDDDALECCSGRKAAIASSAKGRKQSPQRNRMVQHPMDEGLFVPAHTFINPSMKCSRTLGQSNLKGVGQTLCKLICASISTL